MKSGSARLRVARNAAFASALTLLLLAGPATAGVITIDYLITGGAVGPTNLPYFGGGSYRVRVEASGPTTFVNGGAFTLVTLNVTSGAVPQLVGQPGTYSSNGYARTGSLQVNGAITLVVPTIGTYVQIPTGVGAGAYATWKPSVGELLLAAASADASGWIIPSIASIFTGQEVSRTFVPEPRTGTLLIPGALVLAGVLWHRRRLRLA